MSQYRVRQVYPNKYLIELLSVKLDGNEVWSTVQETSCKEEAENIRDFLIKYPDGKVI